MAIELGNRNLPAKDLAVLAVVGTWLHLGASTTSPGVVCSHPLTLASIVSLTAEPGHLKVLAEENAARQSCHGGHGLGRRQQPPLACCHLTPAQSAATSAPVTCAMSM